MDIEKIIEDYGIETDSHVDGDAIIDTYTFNYAQLESFFHQARRSGMEEAVKAILGLQRTITTEQTNETVTKEYLIRPDDVKDWSIKNSLDADGEGGHNGDGV